MQVLELLLAQFFSANHEAVSTSSVPRFILWYRTVYLYRHNLHSRPEECSSCAFCTDRSLRMLAIRGGDTSRCCCAFVSHQQTISRDFVAPVRWLVLIRSRTIRNGVEPKHHRRVDTSLLECESQIHHDRLLYCCVSITKGVKGGWFHRYHIRNDFLNCTCKPVLRSPNTVGPESAIIFFFVHILYL